MLLLDTYFNFKSGLILSFDGSFDIGDMHGLTDTHEKSNNWNEMEDGIWDKLVLDDSYIAF